MFLLFLILCYLFPVNFTKKVVDRFRLQKKKRFLKVFGQSATEQSTNGGFREKMAGLCWQV